MKLSDVRGIGLIFVSLMVLHWNVEVCSEEPRSEKPSYTKAGEQILHLAHYSLRDIKNPDRAVSLAPLKEKLEIHWEKRGVSKSWMEAVWNTYYLYALSLIVSRYRTALWSNREARYVDQPHVYAHSLSPEARATDRHIQEGYSALLQSLFLLNPKVGGLIPNISLFLELNGRTSLAYKKQAVYLDAFSHRDEFHLKLFKAISEHGFDEKWLDINMVTPSETELERWDQELGPWQLANGEKKSHKFYIQYLYGSLGTYETYLASFRRYVKERGWVENYFEDGIARSEIAFLRLIPTAKIEDTESASMWRAHTEVCSAMGRLRALRVPSFILQRLLERVKSEDDIASEKFKEDIQMVKKVYLGAISLPALYVGAAAAIETGILLRMSPVMVKKVLALSMGLPLGVGVFKGTAHFIYKGIGDEKYRTVSNYLNEVVPELVDALPAAVIGPLIGLQVVKAAPELIKPVIYVLVGKGLWDASLQIENGKRLRTQGLEEAGALEIMDGTVDLFVNLGLLRLTQIKIVRGGGGGKGVLSRDIPPWKDIKPQEGATRMVRSVSRPRIARGHRTTVNSEEVYGKAERGTAILEDPKIGSVQMTEEEFRLSWEGSGFEIESKPFPVVPKIGGPLPDDGDEPPRRETEEPERRDGGGDDDEEETIEVVREGDGGDAGGDESARLISRRLVKIKKGLSEAEIRRTLLGLTIQDKIIRQGSDRRTVAQGAFPQASLSGDQGAGFEKGGEGKVEDDDDVWEAFSSRLKDDLQKLQQGQCEVSDVVSFAICCGQYFGVARVKAFLNQERAPVAVTSAFEAILGDDLTPQ